MDCSSGTASPPVLRRDRCARGILHVVSISFSATAGEDPCLGAVLVADGQAFFTLMKVTPMLLDFFRRRRDQQIMGLELLAISLGLSTFHELVVNRNVVIHCDNRGAEVC